MLTIYGVTVLTFMMSMYALERRHQLFVLAFAVGCALSAQLRLSQWYVAVRRCRICLVRHCGSAIFGHLSVGTVERQGLTATPSNM